MSVPINASIAKPAQRLNGLFPRSAVSVQVIVREPFDDGVKRITPSKSQGDCITICVNRDQTQFSRCPVSPKMDLLSISAANH